LPYLRQLIGADIALFGTLQAQRTDLGVEGACVLGGYVDQRRLLSEYSLDVVQAHAKVAHRAHESRPRDGIGTEEPVARLRAPRLGQNARIRVEPQGPHRQSAARRELADHHAVDHHVSTSWRVKRLDCLASKPRRLDPESC